MTATGYALIGLTAIVGMLVAVLTFALLRFVAAARESRSTRSPRGGEPLLMAAALEEAIGRMKAQERATVARAERSEQLSSQIIDSLTSGLIVDSDGREQIVNPAARRILLTGDTRAEAPGNALADDHPLRQTIEESVQSGAPILRRTVSLPGAEGPMHLGVTVCPLTSDRGRAGTICLFTDLTSVLALEEQLQLKEALARLGELTAGLAHEFRNGLATIHGYSRLLDPAVLPDPHKPYVEGIRSETQSLGEIVTNFLNFAKPQPLTLTPLDLHALVVRAADDTPSAEVAISGELGVVDADEVLLRQAVSNLFRNSVEACSADGRPVRIAVHGHVDRTGESIVLTVTDNGPGIAAEALPKLFQPFFTTRPGGTGLGLAIVQKIVVSHNGRIVAGNHPDGGASFTLTLPRPPAAGGPEL